ncbi:sensor histidine kinase [Sinanaerobacter chloroacetimidivorans]|uniref:histidine kinase n=1 Tax=Sinanaerobacter chloroacetimidivorans TaxID=2818044 RepID=A0A8J8B4T0_9FIRM|nr:HAMP domain-containing sensor histidine kinase [Sinanaerobacter chloroacetimidivorans]MBR0599650.1 HAMP domain-containing histidine kinase [Sinanaerobacter chloroacetimidivorans]
MQRFGIFGKVFLYTLLFLLLTIIVTVLVFAQQFKAFYDEQQIRQLNSVFEPLAISMANEDLDDIIKKAEEFHEKNQSFFFTIATKDGNIIYNTESVNQSPSKQNYTIVMALPKNNLRLHATYNAGGPSSYRELINKTIFAAALMLAASVIGAVLFARGITNPIRKLAEDTRKMASFESVSLPEIRRDEVGQLAGDVYNMYEKLKAAISKLEDEIERKKEMEESQRYFFSAASHELKTPIAATSALLEGMLAGIGDYGNHPKYLRECLNMMNSQNRIISEILEIVNLSDERIIPHKEDVNLLYVINTLLPEYSTLAEKKNQTITVRVPETVFCHTDKKMLGRVLSNLIMNAIQNSSEREEIRIWSEVKENDRIRLHILNTNAHIDEETRGKLFEPFYRTDKARSRREERSGLGLTIVKKILDSMDTPFALENSDADVVFWLELPLIT